MRSPDTKKLEIDDVPEGATRDGDLVEREELARGLGLLVLVALAFHDCAEVHARLVNDLARERIGEKRHDAVFGRVRQKAEMPEVDAQDGRIEHVGQPRGCGEASHRRPA